MWKIETRFSWKPIEVDVMDCHFKKVRTQKIWFVNYFMEVGEEKEKVLNNGKPYTLEWLLKNSFLFNLVNFFNLI